MLTIQYCPKCLRKINLLEKNSSFSLMKFFLDTVDFYFIHGLPHICDPDDFLDNARIKILEQNEFLISTENEKDQILIRPLNFHYYQDENELLVHFCFRDHLNVD